MPRQNLTDLSIRKLPHPPKGDVKYLDTQLPGFGVRCTARTKSYFVMHGADRRLTTIARVDEISLREARKRAKGIQAAPRRKNASVSYTEALSAYLTDCRARLRPRTVEEYERPLRLHAPASLSEIDPDAITDPHHVIAFKAFYNWLLTRELVEKNPFAHKKIRTTKRERVLSDDELRALWHYEHPPFSDIVKLLILTGQRRSQIWHLDPSWIQGDTITFPAHEMKQGKPHTIPFGELTAPYLKKVPFTFNGWSKAKLRMDKKTKVTGYTLHDLRRTYATLHAKLGTPIHVVEALLAHTSGTISGVAAIYIRHDFMREMRKAALAYEEHIAKIVG